jgi:hypothetical protein
MDYDKWISYKSGPFILNCNIYILFILYVYNYIYIMCYLEYIYIFFLKVSHLGTKNQENSK